MGEAKPEAVWLADELEAGLGWASNMLQNEVALRQRTATLLRTQHAEIESLKAQVEQGKAIVRDDLKLLAERTEELLALKAQVEALLNDLRLIADTNPMDAVLDPGRAVRVAKAAIDAAREKANG